VRARPRSGEKRGGFGREWRRSEEVERERERLGRRSARGGAARRWEGMGAAPRAEREERRGAEERGWSLRARILGFQLVLFYTIGVRSEPSDWRWMVKNDWAIWAEMAFYG